MVVNRNATFFIGREHFLQELHETLQARRFVAIQAPAGMGKTAAALAYARRFSQAYEWIFKMNAASPEIWLADSLELVARLGLPIAGEQNLANVNQELQQWFANHQNYLLIMENVNDVTLLSAPEQASGHILFLTRKPISDPSIPHIALEKLDAREGALLLLRQTGQIPDEMQLEEANEASRLAAVALAEEMDGGPLVLHLGSAYIRATGSNLQAYLATYREYAARLVQLKVSRDRATDALAITCSLPTLYLQKTQQVAAELLWICTVLAPIDIPREFFILGASELTPALQEIEHMPALLDEALTLLSSLGLLATNGLLGLRSSVQETLCQAQPQERRGSLAAQALRAFAHLLPSLKQAAPAERIRGVAHILSLAALSSDWLIFHKPVAEVLDWAAALLWEQGLIQGAEMLLRKALQIRERTLGIEHAMIGVMQRNLATMNALLKNYIEAETWLKSALIALSRSLGATHPDVIHCLLDLADIYGEQGKTRERQACYEEALKIGEPALGRKHPLLITVAHKLASSYVEEERFEEAEAYYQRILPVYEASLGVEDNVTQACLEQIGTVYLQQEKLEEAGETFQRLLAAKERTLGVAHPDTITVRQRIALIAVAREQWEQAEEMYRCVLPCYEERGSDLDQTEIVQCLELLANVYLQQRKFAEAEAMLQRALKMREQALGANHPDVATSLIKLAELHLSQERPERAVPLLQRALSICIQPRVPDLLTLSIIFDDLALVSAERGLPEEAASLQETARSLLPIISADSD
ncbi:MAG TPA: tetratricopeptide repeat protein [Ktedonobacteraceae bacterium]|jgi:tetratricopeptide (TPR) repeat protein|nr:tetratricopeptide repeat protein [Ktedonobacteraceae bacterium]